MDWEFARFLNCESCFRWRNEVLAVSNETDFGMRLRAVVRAPVGMQSGQSTRGFAAQGLMADSAPAAPGLEPSKSPVLRTSPVGGGDAASPRARAEPPEQKMERGPRGQHPGQGARSLANRYLGPHAGGSVGLVFRRTNSQTSEWGLFS